MQLDPASLRSSSAGPYGHTDNKYDAVDAAVREAKQLIETAVLSPNSLQGLKEKKGVALLMYQQELQRKEQQLQAEGLPPPPPWGLKVNLSNLCIGPRHGESVAHSMILNNNVTLLDLSGCDLGTEGAVAVLRCLQRNHTLEHLALSGNFLEPPAAVAAAAVLATPSCSLQSLALSCNKIGDDGAAALADSLRTNRTLTFLNVRGNGITDVGASALLDSMTPPTNPSLTALWVQLNPISPELVGRITQVLAEKCPAPPETGKKKKKKQ